jgi:hypothetical protein
LASPSSRHPKRRSDAVTEWATEASLIKRASM